MKKQKMLKLTAYLSDPSAENSFSTPVTHSGEISVVFRGKNVSIHGFDGSAWTTIYTWNSLDPQYQMNNTYQSYYLKSLTGSEETLNVSFFSTEKYQGSTPQIAGIDRATKLHDIDEVPIYTSSDENKMLTIMSNGSLAWLLANESFIVPSEGGEESQDDSNNPNVASPSLIADVLNHPSTTIVGNPVYQDNILTLDGSSYMIHGDIAEFMYQDYMTTNLWFRNDGGSRKSKLWSFGAEYTSNNKFAHVLQQNNDADLRFVSAAGTVTNPNHYSIYDDAWHMITAVWDNVNGVKRLYLDGVQLGSDINFSAKVNPFRDGDDVYGLIIGTGTGLGVVRSNEAYKGQFTKMEVENSVWDSSQITSKFNEGSGIPTIQSSPGAFLEDLSSVIARDASKFTNGIYRDTQTGSSGGMKVELKDDGILEYDPVTNETVNDEFTISWWMHLDSTQVAGNLGLVGSNVASVNGEVRRFTFNLGGGAALTDPDLYSYTRGARTTQNRETGVSMAGVWTHAAIVIRNDSSNTVASLYLNGSKLNNSISYPLGTKLFPPSTHQTFVFGAGSQSYSVKGLFDSMQIADGVALTDEQVAAIAGQSDRQMSIETAAASVASYTPTGAGTFLEDFTMFGGGTVTDGVLSTIVASPSYYKKSGMVPPSTTATTAVFSMWFNPTQSRMGLYSDQHYPSQVNFGLRMWSTSLLHISTPIGNSSGVTLATPLTLNEWHHALVTVETDIAYTSTSSKSMTVKLFIDGQEVYTKTGNSSTTRIRAYAGMSNGTKHYIGAENYNGSVSYKGDGQFDFMEWVDDITLSDAQILAMYNGGTRDWSVADAVNYQGGGSSNSYLETDATLFGGANLSNDSLVLDGIDDYAVIDDGFRFTDKMTTSVWFKTTATGDRRIYSSHVRSMSGEDYRNGFFARLNDGQLKFRHPAGGTGELTGPSGLNDGTWHHLALSWEASVGYTLYVDGSQVGSGASGVSDGYVSDWGLYIGANPWNRTPQEPYAFFDGEIKKFEVLNEVLTSQQVTDLYNAGA